MRSPCTPGNGSRALAMAAVLTADALTHGRTPEEIGRMASFFTVLGDTMALLSEGRSIEARIAMIAITTNSSMSVNPMGFTRLPTGE